MALVEQDRHTPRIVVGIEVVEVDRPIVDLDSGLAAGTEQGMDRLVQHLAQQIVQRHVRKPRASSRIPVPGSISSDRARPTTSPCQSRLVSAHQAPAGPGGVGAEDGHARRPAAAVAAQPRIPTDGPWTAGRQVDQLDPADVGSDVGIASSHRPVRRPVWGATFRTQFHTDAPPAVATQPKVTTMLNRQRSRPTGSLRTSVPPRITSRSGHGRASGRRGSGFRMSAATSQTSLAKVIRLQHLSRRILPRHQHHPDSQSHGPEHEDLETAASGCRRPAPPARRTCPPPSGRSAAPAASPASPSGAR